MTGAHDQVRFSLGVRYRSGRADDHRRSRSWVGTSEGQIRWTLLDGPVDLCRSCLCSAILVADWV